MELLKDILSSSREERKYPVEEIVEKTGIPARFLEYLESGVYEKLPPDAYVYGYLRKLAGIYALDKEELWERYKNEKGALVRSGAGDYFPGSKKTESSESVARRGRNAALSVPVVLVAILFGYIGWQVSTLVRTPRVDIVAPERDITISEAQYTVRGVVEPGSLVTINDDPVAANDSGGFEKLYTLQEGMNIFTFKVRKPLGREKTLTRGILYISASRPEGNESGVNNASPGDKEKINLPVDSVPTGEENN